MPSDTHLSRQPIEADAQPGGTFDAVIVGAGLAGLYMLHRLRGSGSRRGSTRRVAASGARGSGTVIRATVRYRKLGILVFVLGGARAGMGVDRALRLSAGDPAVSQSRRRSVRPAPDVQLETRVTAAVFDETAGRWTIKQIGANKSRRSSASWRQAACLPRKCPDSRGSKLEGRGITPGAGPKKASTSPVSGSA